MSENPSSSRSDDLAGEAVIIPHTELSAEALRGVVESFVLREGTDYGERELTLAEKLARVYRQLERSEARIVFDPVTETVDVVLTRSLLPRSRGRAD